MFKLSKLSPIKAVIIIILCLFAVGILESDEQKTTKNNEVFYESDMENAFVEQDFQGFEKTKQESTESDRLIHCHDTYKMGIFEHTLCTDKATLTPDNMTLTQEEIDCYEKTSQDPVVKFVDSENMKVSPARWYFYDNTLNRAECLGNTPLSKGLIKEVTDRVWHRGQIIKVLNRLDDMQGHDGQ